MTDKVVPQLLTNIHKQKIALDKLRPFDKMQLQNLRNWFRIGFIQNSNAIEGNTLSLSEVKVLLEDGITIGGKTVKELKETLNHGSVMDILYDFFEGNRQIINEELIIELHTVLMQGNLDPMYLGRRSIEVRISGSSDICPKPSKVPQLMREFFESAYVNPLTLEDVARIHYDFVKIHPFVDGNGRIARVLMNLGLIKLGYFPIIIPVVLRSDYIDSLSGDSFEKRYSFFARQVYENHKDYVRFFKNK